ncbi:MAG: hypothetical protein JKX91_01410 [Rhizobiaceae bacterium]|nr:hypothetical protein [Rhizobiaceae bacterium]
MSSTSKQMALELFDDKLVKLASENPSLHLQFRSDPANGSYFQPARQNKIDRGEMEKMGLKSELSGLHDLWQGKLSALQPLVPLLEQLAETIAVERIDAEDDPDAPSSTIYQMW